MSLGELSPGAGVVRAGQGPAIWMVGDTYTLKATSESTGGAFALIEASIPSGGGPPPHIHTREDEAFYLLSGQLQVSVGDETTLVRGGDFVYLPRGIAHSFTNPGVSAAHALLLITPGGFEGFFAELGTRARVGEQAPPFDPSDFERVAEATRRYGGELVAPAGPPR
ncbi:quercetin 2,3-dioxygenase [Pseudonocardia spinosispora]|uniref:quercetin 2,3-dioxygenase n=1 Tax=Pseudonocardia spinosispora TaxID=103441 RepID=UPI000688BCDB|nr:quercetin 2,3-dioxygenase [Pseudonocardia spinosispora]